jgi:hypothetical protein
MNSQKHSARAACWTSRHLDLVLLSALAVWVQGEAVPLQAYIDPGSGSMLLQLLLGGTAGLLVLARLSGRRLINRVKRLFSRRGDGE